MIRHASHRHPIGAEVARLGILVALAWATVWLVLPTVLEFAAGR
jgi:hypothetical protein